MQHAVGELGAHRGLCRPVRPPCLQKRASLLATHHVRSGEVPSIEEANASEDMLQSPSACRPRIVFGCTLDEALGGTLGASAASGSLASLMSLASFDGGGGGCSSTAARQLRELVPLYAGERYLLSWREGTAYVLLQEGAEPLDLMRAMWQAAWLERHAEQQQGAGAAAAAGNGSGSPAAACEGTDALAASLEALRQRWPAFAAQAAAQGWQLDKAVLPRGRTLVRLE